MTQFSPRLPALLAAVLLATAASAQDKPDGLFHGSASLGASFASGIVNSTTLSAAFDLSRKTNDDKLSFFGLAARGDTKESGFKLVTTDLYRLGGRYDRDFNKQVFGFVSGELERNGVTELDLRAAAYLGAGYHVLATPKSTLDVYAGIGYNRSKYSFDTLSGAELMIGEEGSYKLSETTTLKQRINVYPSLKSENGYRATLDATLAVAMGGGWNVNVGVGARYANKIYVGKKTESLFTVGLGYKF